MKPTPRLFLEFGAMALCAGLTSGCGAEVAGTAAAVGALQVEQAKQAKAQQERAIQAFKKAQDIAAAQREAAAASAAQ